jgi:uncharacterized protein (UPF0264 family)
MTISEVHQSSPTLPRLLVSARTLEEAVCLVESGTHWLDLKEPSLGSLGRPSISLVQQLLRMEIPDDVHVSVAGGELKDWSPQLSSDLAAILPRRFHLKLALADCKGVDWVELASQVSRSMLEPSQLILVHYADSDHVEAPDWQSVVEASRALGCRFVLIDTCNKKSGGLLDLKSPNELREMIRLAAGFQLGVALAGSLKLDQLKSLSDVGAQWLGIRGAVCKNADRTSALCQHLLHQAVSMFQDPSGIES